jgi:hypothetical protein
MVHRAYEETKARQTQKKSGASKQRQLEVGLRGNAKEKEGVRKRAVYVMRG